MGEDGLEDSQDAQVPWFRSEVVVGRIGMGRSWFFILFVHVFEMSKIVFDIF